MTNTNTLSLLKELPTKTKAPALKLAFNILQKWDTNEDQQIALLGNPDKETFEQWQKEQASSLTQEAFLSIFYIMNIYKSLGIIFSNKEQAEEWLNKPNEYFNGKSAMELLTTGEKELKDIHKYLAHQLH